MRHLKICFVFLLPILFISCGKLSDITIGEINGVSVKGFEDNAMLVTLSVPVENPTRHKITVSDLNMKVYMNNQYLGKATTKDPIVLKAKTDEVHDLVMEVRLANIFGTALTLMNLQKGRKVLFRLEGTVNARSFLMRRKIEINESREVTF